MLTVRLSTILSLRVLLPRANGSSSLTQAILSPRALQVLTSTLSPQARKLRTQHTATSTLTMFTALLQEQKFQAQVSPRFVHSFSATSPSTARSMYSILSSPAGDS